MRIFKSVFSQCGRPDGFLGRMVLRSMNLFHAPVTNWGLGYVDFKAGMKMLDIGCGGGATLKRLLNRSADSMVYGIDISEESVAKARKVNFLINRSLFRQDLLNNCHGMITLLIL